MVLGRVMSAVFLTFLIASTVGGQTSALRGRVTDSQGGVVVNAMVSLTGPAAARPRTVRTLADGTFVFEGIAHGRYVVQVESESTG